MTRSKALVLAGVLVVALLLPGCLGAFGQDAGGAAPGAQSLGLRLSASAPAVGLGSPLAFTAEVDRDPATLAFEWDLGDGEQLRGTGLTLIRHTFSEPGSYLVRVRVTAADGASSEATRRVAVDQHLEVSGSLTTLAGLREAEPYTTRGALSEGGAALAVDLRLTRGAAAVPLPTPAQAVVTLRSPTGATLLLKEVAVPAEGVQVNATAPATVAGEYTLEIRAKEGTLAFTGVLTLAYTRDSAT
ncbi:MAG TPA: PKD domain-containing protein [Candidatus Thermoplasmatota archaeon]|nr:PKD domain-containing protein [Candidatus Thermoplasmatota archaeon]